MSADLRPEDEPVTVLPVGRLADADDGEPCVVLVLPMPREAAATKQHDERQISAFCDGPGPLTEGGLRLT